MIEADVQPANIFAPHFFAIQVPREWSADDADTRG